jgi:acyl carrier protein
MLIEERIKRCMSEVFGVAIEAIPEDASVRSIQNWKGLNHLKLVEALQKEFGITFEDGEVETLVSYKVIKATIMAYVG